jgi:hypothetical protein
MNKFKCKICGKEISPNTKRCQECYIKTFTGATNPNATQQGKTTQKYYCKCGKEICYQTVLYGLGMCKLCAAKKRKHKSHSKETKEKIGKGNIGKVMSLKARDKIGKANKGKKRTEATKQKMSKINLGKNNPFYGKHHTKESTEIMKKSSQIRWQDPKQREKLSLTKGGTGNPYENYDLAFSIRLLYKYNNWRTEIFKRDNFTCQECGQIGHHLEAHHLKEFSIIFKEFLNLYPNYNSIKDKEILIQLAINYKPFWEVSNGQTLCKDCHKLTDNYKNNRRINHGH